MVPHLLSVLTLLCLVFTPKQVFAGTKYYGRLLGNFRTNAHGVRGEVYAANENTFFIKGFEYDGQGPDAFFWGDTREAPSPSGFIIPDERGTKDVLKRYSGHNLIITLPDGKSIKDMRSLSVWCRRFAVNFGSIIIPQDLDLPKEQNFGPLSSIAHGVRSGDVIIKDAKTIFISNLYYDGAGPDAFFLVGVGPRPNSKGTKVPDETLSLQKLKGYQGKDITLHLPGDLTVFDVDWFALYCIAFEQNFGHVTFPRKPNVPANLDDLHAAAKGISVVRSRSISSGKSEKVKVGKYYGKYIGDFKTNAHDVKGSVYAASENTFFITSFSYDGQGPDAFFWVGTSEKPSPSGMIVPDEFGTQQVLKKYTNQNIAITLPDGLKVTDVKWLSVWCRKFAVDFGHVMVPDDFQLPREQDLGPLPSLAHGTKADNVIVKDAKTIFIRGLHYDGAAPDAFFYVGTGRSPGPVGIKVPDENGSLNKIKGYHGNDVTLRLPDDLTVFDIDWFALYCISYKENFGHVMIPENLNVPADVKVLKMAEINFENCEEIFPGVLQVAWKVRGQDLVVRLTGAAGENEYLSFGRSGHDERAEMVGADVVVAYYDTDEKSAKAVDYYLSAKSQCSQGSGACPDTKLKGNDNVKLISWEKSDGHLSVTYSRPLAAGDGQDLSIPLSIPVSVIAAIGSVNSQKEAAFHSNYYTKDPVKIHFGRDPPRNSCKQLHHALHEPVKGWSPLHITGETTFRAVIGPTGGDKGYTAITGIQSWGYAWWINDLLIPEITVQRGVNYTFIVEGGQDSSNSAKFHPFYITNNAEGGGGQFLEDLGTEKHKVYAGVLTDGQKLIPVGVGRLCEWKPKTVDMAEESDTFEDYKKTLKLECEEGMPGIFNWVPDEDTPDLVYYQCFTHRNLGWKIQVQGKMGEPYTMGHLSGTSPSLLPSFYFIFVVKFVLWLCSFL